MKDILLLMSSFKIVKVAHIGRKFNETAHLLAKFSFVQDENFEWSASFPVWLDMISF